MRVFVLFLAMSLVTFGQGRQGRRGPDNAPKVGEAIPEVKAVTFDGEGEVDLSKPEKVTVLIFGSHT